MILVRRKRDMPPKKLPEPMNKRIFSIITLLLNQWLKYDVGVISLLRRFQANPIAKTNVLKNHEIGAIYSKTCFSRLRKSIRSEANIPAEVVFYLS